MDQPRILVVDDEIIIAREMEARLKGMGYGIAGIASSGAEAVRLADDERPDLVIMDIVLKGDMDGIEAAAELRRRRPCPVIYVTAYTDKETLARAKVTEPFAYLVKPFSERELHANIEMALYKHRVEARLRRLERWFTVAMNDIGDAVIAADSQGVITEFNTAAEAITAWKRSEAVGRNLWDVLRLVDRHKGIIIPLAELADGPVVCLSRDTSLLDKSNHPVPVDSTISCIRDEDDRPTGIVSVFRDASGQRHGALIALGAEITRLAAQKLAPRQMLEACAEALVHHLDMAFARIWTLDESGKTLLLQASAGLYTHLDGAHGRVPVGHLKIGKIAEEREPHLTNDVLHDPRLGDPEWARREGMTAFAGYPLVFRGRLLGVMAMFSRKPINENVLDALGSIAAAVSVAIEQRELEGQVREARERLQSVIASSPAVLYTLAGEDAQSLRLTWISENVETMMGYPLDQVMHPDWWASNVHPDEFEGVAAELGATLFTTGRLSQEYRFRNAAGVYRWVRSELRVLAPGHGETTEIVGSWSDITERKKLEDQFRQAQKMEAVGQLAGGVAHDFNNLLTVISGYSTILSTSGNLEPRNLKLVEEISKAGARAASLTRQLLAFSRKQILEMKILDLNALILDQHKMLRRLIGEDVVLTTELEPGLAPVRGDASQMEQIILNLAVNARDAMPQGGRLTVTTRMIDIGEGHAQLLPGCKPGPHVMLAVSDDGCGMTAEVKTRIFEPFFTTKGLGKGTGLGLATVYGIVQQCGGHMDVYSEPGLGTTFKIYLPPAESAGVPADSERGPRPMPLGTETILLVEDEDAVRAIARHTLDSCGYQVLEASNGKDALQLIESHTGPVHLIVTDVVMPEMAGRPLVEHASQIRPGIRILYMSGYTDDAVIRHGVLQADTAFLQKPFSPLSLALKVREVLD